MDLRRITLSCWLAAAAACGGPSAAHAASPGGAEATDGPEVQTLRCVSTKRVRCPSAQVAAPGSKVLVRGVELARVRTITFLGAAGRGDDVSVRAEHARPTQVDAVVPSRAKSGPLQLRTTSRELVSAPALDVAAPAPPPVAASVPDGGVFPIRGKHDLVQSATNDFGGARNHQGQDLFADCGTPLAVAQGGTVRKAGYDATAGNFAVITSTSTGQDAVYMHMAELSQVATGQAVTAGQPLGQVGDSGNAQGCHLHFELWSAPGWYVGGAAVDPLPQLQAWDRQDPPHRH